MQIRNESKVTLGTDGQQNQKNRPKYTNLKKICKMKIQIEFLPTGKG